MPNCQRCSKPVYFAERKTSLGKEWHRQCLSCEECGKVLHPGQHAEHKGKPYCHLPCYSARFGPHIKGYGVPTSGYNIYSHTGTMKNKIGSYTIGGVDKEEILYKLHRYNEHNAVRNGQLDWKEDNGRLIISGLLRLHWRINKQIQFKSKDDIPTATNLGRPFRKSFVMAMNNGRSLDPKELLHIYDDDPLMSAVSNPSIGRSASPTTSANDRTGAQRERTNSTDDSIIMRKKKSDIQRFHTVCYKGERTKSKRFSINGHFYDGETSIFTPAHGTVTTVHVNSANTTQEVIQALLDKFKVENRADEFCLIEARRHGEMNRLLSTDYPLLERVLLGPEEDEAKIFIMESDTVAKTEGVNQYVSLPEAVLRGFLEKFHSEEVQAQERIRSRFARYRDKLQNRLWEMTSGAAGESET